jgi:hypothetical protein
VELLVEKVSCREIKEVRLRSLRERCNGLKRAEGGRSTKSGVLTLTDELLKSFRLNVN